EVIRKHSHSTTLALKEGAAGNDLLDRLKADPFMARVDIDAVVAAGNFAGRAPEQVDEYLAEVVEPALEPYRNMLGQKAELHV
ncbi:MAG: adenylosuccinate lyase, partial [Planctomycetes bacterium]|nr:adenylosuccinate lyase [Planctomycetota bacterium]